MMTSTSEQADTSMYVLNGEWHLVSMPAKLNKVFYNCCNYPFYDVTLTLDIKRKPLYYVFNLIMPCGLDCHPDLDKVFLTTRVRRESWSWDHCPSCNDGVLAARGRQFAIDLRAHSFAWSIFCSNNV